MAERGLSREDLLVEEQEIKAELANRQKRSVDDLLDELSDIRFLLDSGAV
jgi:ribosomal protein L29